MASRAGLLAALAALASGCGQLGSTDIAAPRYQMQAITTPQGAHLIRFDTINGDVWSAPLVGGLTWSRVGDALGHTVGPLEPGRFEFDFVQAKSTPLLFLRLDTLAGTAWRLSYPTERSWQPFLRGD